MIDPDAVPPVAPDELLARYVLQSNYFRSSDLTVKPDAFVPYPHRDTSVTRHRDATESEIWDCGRAVAAETDKTLYGRADVVAADCLAHRLTVIAAPLKGNSNHADISSWPPDKPTQKIVALEIAAAAKFIPVS